MPSGKTHQRINEAAMALATPAAFAVAWSVTDDPVQAAILTAYGLGGMLFGTYLADPDLDHDHITHTEARIRKIRVLGRPLHLLFVAFWYPYARMSKHRGPSHWPVVGTLGRLGYIIAMLALLNALGRWVLLGTPEHWADPLLALIVWGVRNPARAGAWMAGECLADFLHSLTDRFWPHPVQRTRRVGWRSLD